MFKSLISTLLFASVGTGSLFYSASRWYSPEEPLALPTSADWGSSSMPTGADPIPMTMVADVQHHLASPAQQASSQAEEADSAWEDEVVPLRGIGPEAPTVSHIVLNYMKEKQIDQPLYKLVKEVCNCQNPKIGEERWDDVNGPKSSRTLDPGYEINLTCLDKYLRKEGGVLVAEAGIPTTEKIGGAEKETTEVEAATTMETPVGEPSEPEDEVDFSPIVYPGDIQTKDISLLEDALPGEYIVTVRVSLPEGMEGGDIRLKIPEGAGMEIVKRYHVLRKQDGQPGSEPERGSISEFLTLAIIPDKLCGRYQIDYH